MTATDRIPTPTAVGVYISRQLPTSWVVDAGGLWMVPTIYDGWQHRTPYRGYRASLELAGHLGHALRVGIFGRSADLPPGAAESAPM